MQVYTSAKVKNPDHPRFDQVGTIVSAGDPVQVKFDEPEAPNGYVVDVIPADQLQALV